jgi:hypothetical protein
VVKLKALNYIKFKPKMKEERMYGGAIPGGAAEGACTYASLMYSID